MRNAIALPTTLEIQKHIDFFEITTTCIHHKIPESVKRTFDYIKPMITKKDLVFGSLESVNEVPSFPEY